MPATRAGYEAAVLAITKDAAGRADDVAVTHGNVPALSAFAKIGWKNSSLHQARKAGLGTNSNIGMNRAGGQPFPQNRQTPPGENRPLFGYDTPSDARFARATDFFSQPQAASAVRAGSVSQVVVKSGARAHEQFGRTRSVRTSDSRRGHHLPECPQPSLAPCGSRCVSWKYAFPSHRTSCLERHACWGRAASQIPRRRCWTNRTASGDSGVSRT